MNTNLVEFLTQVLQTFGPLVLQLVSQWQQDHRTSQLPTIEDLRRDYQDLIDSYLAEGAAWRAAHPEV